MYRYYKLTQYCSCKNCDRMSAYIKCSICKIYIPFCAIKTSNPIVCKQCYHQQTEQFLKPRLSDAINKQKEA